MKTFGKTVFALAVIGSFGLAACGGGGDSGTDAGGGSGSGSGGGSATVLTVDCSSGSADATVTTPGFKYLSTPAGSGGDQHSDIPLNGIIKFNLVPSMNHPVQPYSGTDSAGKKDSGLHAADNAVTCLKFTAPGVYDYDCAVHGTAGGPLHGIVTVGN